MAKTCKNLKELKLSQNEKITAKSLEAIALNCKNMSRLIINWSNIPADGYHPLLLNCHKLTCLSVSTSSLTDKECELIAASKFFF